MIVKITTEKQIKAIVEKEVERQNKFLITRMEKQQTQIYKLEEMIKVLRI